MRESDARDGNDGDEKKEEKKNEKHKNVLISCFMQNSRLTFRAALSNNSFVFCRLTNEVRVCDNIEKNVFEVFYFSGVNGLEWLW